MLRGPMSQAIASAVDSVTVFRRGALVTRTARLEKGDGYPSEVRLTGLPLALDDASITVSTKSDEGEAPVATDLRVCLEVPEADASLAPPTDERLEAARLDAEHAQATVSRLDRRRQRIAKLAIRKRPAPAEGEPPIPSPTEGRNALVALREAALEKLDELIFAAQKDAEEKQRALRRLEADKTRATTARQARAEELRKTVVVTLADGATAPSARLSIDYRVPGARWAPSYAVRFDRELSRADLTVRALVRQGSGEDWSNVKMRLSTASWQSWSELPKLKALRIGRRQPPAPPKWRPPPTGAEALFADFDAAAPARSGGPMGNATFVDEGPKTDPDVVPAMPSYDEPEPEGASYEIEAPTGDILADLNGVGMPPPPPMPSAVPMSAPPPMPMLQAPQAPMAKKSRSILPSFGGAPMMRSGAPPPPGAGGGAPMRRPAPPPPPPEPVPDQDLLEYGRLRMMGARDPGRGKLQPQSRYDRYQALLVAQKVSVSFDVVSIVVLAESAAHAVDDSSPAPRHRFAQTEDGFDYAYEVLGTADVPSDTRDRSLPIAAESSGAAARYVAVPRETADVFRTVTFENPLAAPLLAGPIDVYVAGTYLTTVDLKTTVAGGEVRLGLGVEQAIKISRNVRYEEQAAGLIRGSRDLVHAIEIELANNLSRDATVEVRERVPVAEERDDDVKVTIEDVQPEWQPFEQDDEVLRGGYRWRVQVPASDTKQLTAKYTIRIKSGEELIGGNRREA